MPNLLHNSDIRDNHRRGSVADFLKAKVQTGRGLVIPNQQEQAREATDFELITWLVIKAP